MFRKLVKESWATSSTEQLFGPKSRTKINVDFDNSKPQIPTNAIQVTKPNLAIQRKSINLKAARRQSLRPQSCGQRFEQHWVDWLEDTSFHGPKETYRAKYIVEKLFWMLMVAGLTAWSVYTSTTIFYIYFSEKESSDTVAISPSDTNVFELLQIVYCPTDWLDYEKAATLGIDKDMAEYMKEVLEVATGKGIGIFGTENNSTLAKKKEKNRIQSLHGRMITLLQRNSAKYATLRSLYEDIAYNFSTYLTKKRLCPNLKGNFCPYNVTPQISMGYTIRKGRVCQHFKAVEDKVAKHDPLLSATTVYFSLVHRHQNAPNTTGSSKNISVSVRPYLGELLTTGLSNSTGLSFKDLLNFSPYNKYCQYKIAISLYHIQRIRTSHYKCQLDHGKTRQPRNYPSDTCKLLCVDRIYYQKKQKCSLFFPLYNVHFQANFVPQCNPVDVYEAMLASENGDIASQQYTDCVKQSECEKKFPCDEWFGILSVLEDESACELGNNPNDTRVRIELWPKTILEIKYTLQAEFADMYSKVGGVLSLALGGSLISIAHLIQYTVKSVCTLDRRDNTRLLLQKKTTS